MAWYKGVECRRCKSNVAIKKLLGPQKRTLDAAGPPAWLGAGIVCHHCQESAFYVAEDFKIFEAKEPVSGSIVSEKFAGGITAVRKRGAS